MTKKDQSKASAKPSSKSTPSQATSMNNEWIQQDPEARREAEKYDNPIPSRELILQLLETRGAPATRAQLQQEFALQDEDSIEALRRPL